MADNGAPDGDGGGNDSKQPAENAVVSGKWGDYSLISRLSPTTLLIVDVVWFVVLIAMLLGRVFDLLSADRLPAVIDGVLPIIVPWAGAFGGVTVSIVGVVAHWSEWGPRIRDKTAQPVPDQLRQRQDFNAWHLTRPLVGMAFGTFAALIVVLITGTVARTATNAVDVSPTGAATLMIISFVVGYRETTFRLLIERVIDTIIGPGTDTTTGVTFELAPDALDFATLTINATSDPKTVTLTNPSNKTIQTATLVIEGDPSFTLDTSRLSGIGANASTPITLRCSPVRPGTLQGTLSVTVGGTTKHVQLKATAQQ